MREITIYKVNSSIIEGYSVEDVIERYNKWHKEQNIECPRITSVNKYGLMGDGTTIIVD